MKRVLIAKLTLVVIAVFLAGNSFAQKKDSAAKATKKDTLKIFHSGEDAFAHRYLAPFYTRHDTSLAGLQKLFTLSEEHPFTARFSNVGLAYRDLDFNTDYNSDFTTSRQYFKDYFLTNENAKYYNASSPYADVFYVMGPKKEQMFDVLFTRNFKKNLNLSAQYKIIHSPGKYLDQKSDDAFAIFTGNYSTKDQRYRAIGNYFYNRMYIQENGGLKDDSDFTQNLFHNRQLINVNLINSSAENKIKESGFYIKQFYFLGFNKKEKKDTTTTYKYIGLGQITHSILFKNQSYLYTDATPMLGFFPAPLLDTALTHDSIHINTIENTLSWSNLKFNIQNNSQFFTLHLAIKHDLYKLWGNNVDTTLSSLTPQADVKFRFGKHIELTGNGFYVINGYRKNDYSGTAMLADYYTKDTVNVGYFGAKADIFMQSPAWFDQQYSSNYFYWNYSFKQLNVEKASVFFTYKKLALIVSYSMVKNYIYYDSFARPQQYAGEMKLLQITLNKDFKWRKLEFDNKILYQKTYDADVIRLPELMSNHAFYFTQPLFKNALLLQLGFEVTFFSSYQPLAWMPVTKEFYLQTNYKTDNYPYIDVFMNFKIKRARIFLKLDHANADFMGYNYYLIPHNPAQDMALKFGVTWQFYN